MTERKAQGRVWRRFVDMIVQRDKGRCWICGHYGARSVDHIVPVTEDPSREWDRTNCKAAHAWPHGCTDCTYAAAKLGNKPVYCNGVKGGYSIERARRLIEERTGLQLFREVTAEGRDWLFLGRFPGAFDGEKLADRDAGRFRRAHRDGLDVRAGHLHHLLGVLLQPLRGEHDVGRGIVQG